MSCRTGGGRRLPVDVSAEQRVLSFASVGPHRRARGHRKTKDASMGPLGKRLGGTLAMAGSIGALSGALSIARAQDETVVTLPSVEVSTRLLRGPNRAPARSGAPAAVPSSTPAGTEPTPPPV